MRFANPRRPSKQQWPIMPDWLGCPFSRCERPTHYRGQRRNWQRSSGSSQLAWVELVQRQRAQPAEVRRLPRRNQRAGNPTHAQLRHPAASSAPSWYARRILPVGERSIRRPPACRKRHDNTRPGFHGHVAGATAVRTSMDNRRAGPRASLRRSCANRPTCRSVRANRLTSSARTADSLSESSMFTSCNT